MGSFRHLCHHLHWRSRHLLHVVHLPQPESLQCEHQEWRLCICQGAKHEHERDGGDGSAASTRDEAETADAYHSPALDVLLDHMPQRDSLVGVLALRPVVRPRSIRRVVDSAEGDVGRLAPPALPGLCHRCLRPPGLVRGLLLPHPGLLVRRYGHALLRGEPAAVLDLACGSGGGSMPLLGGDLAKPLSRCADTAGARQHGLRGRQPRRRRGRGVLRGRGAALREPGAVGGEGPGQGLHDLLQGPYQGRLPGLAPGVLPRPHLHHAHAAWDAEAPAERGPQPPVHRLQDVDGNHGLVPAALPGVELRPQGLGAHGGHHPHSAPDDLLAGLVDHREAVRLRRMPIPPVELDCGLCDETLR
mmetsp:Transcript_80406/g.260551  ORF Transcript_80406/g.260551 Transcript_80406/m.260551 type:complete len:359 (+) Transcript_80406:1042-2118(+)